MNDALGISRAYLRLFASQGHEEVAGHAPCDPFTQLNEGELGGVIDDDEQIPNRFLIEKPKVVIANEPRKQGNKLEQ